MELTNLAQSWTLDRHPSAANGELACIVSDCTMLQNRIRAAGGEEGREGMGARG